MGEGGEHSVSMIVVKYFLKQGHIFFCDSTKGAHLEANGSGDILN